MSDRPRTIERRRAARVALSVVAVSVTLLLLVEGLASVVLLGRDAADLWRPLEERAHTRHDSALGWTSEPGTLRPDAYGDGVGLTINDQGFRHPRTVGRLTPADTARVICSGGTATFGPGVDDAATWCAALGRVDARVDAINMGQLGYGLDQALLWYGRDGASLDQDVHLVAVSADAIERMRDRRWLSYDKPRLAVEAGRLATIDAPVPQRSAVGVRARGLVRLIAASRTAELARRLVGAQPAAESMPPGSSGADPLHSVITMALDELVEGHRDRGSLVVLVFLPTRQDYAGRASEAWRAFMRDAARDRMPFVDLVAELRTVPPGDVDRYFLADAVADHALAAGHYSAAGHEFLGRALYRRLLTMPVVRARLAARETRAPATDAR